MFERGWPVVFVVRVLEPKLFQQALGGAVVGIVPGEKSSRAQLGEGVRNHR